MSYTLLIVESPAKCCKIEKYLGVGYKCVASFGHLREIKGLDSIDIKNNFKPTFIEIEEKIKQINKIRGLIKNAVEVIIGSDDDREGEAIAWHICEIFELPIKTTKRIIFHEITEMALNFSVKNPKLINMGVVNAQISRQILDILVGYKLSPLLWKNIAKNNKYGLSAGRCQTPALRIIYDNQKEIDNFSNDTMYNTIGYFTSKNIPFTLNFNHKCEKDMISFLKDSIKYQHIFTCESPQNITKHPPTPLTTSKLQQMASNDLNLSPKDTMQICQKLYEAGHITYMRTDSNNYSNYFISVVSTYIPCEYGKQYLNTKLDEYFLKEDTHEAIRPTNINVKTLNGDEFNSKEIKMYVLIRRNTLESCMEPARYKGITAMISSPIDKSITYNFSSEQVIFPGWKIVNGYESINNIYAYLLTLKPESKIDNKKITSKIVMKNIKLHYSEAYLVQLLEKYGIGRPSTFSSLIEKIQERGYVKKENVNGVKMECIDFELESNKLSEIKTSREFGNEKNKLIIQPIGVLVIEFLLNNFEKLFDYNYTKNMEESLDHIAKGNKESNILCKECFDEIEELCEIFFVKNEKCNKDELVGEIRIDNEHTYMNAKYGRVIKYTINDEVTNKSKISFKKIKPEIEIDIDKLQNGEYELNDLVCESKLSGRMLGVYEGHEIILKKGKFGMYITWGNLKKSISINKCEEEIKLEDIISLVKIKDSDKLIESSIVRVINNSLSIRCGKYSDYIFYKKEVMKKPKFFKLEGFKEDYKNCKLSVLKKWIKETYNV